MPSAPGVSEQELRDVWARWTELRPEWLDWRIEIALRADTSHLERPAAEIVSGRHVARIELHGPPPVTLITAWELDSSRTVELLNALCEALACEELMRLVAAGAVGWQDTFTMWVWRQL